jgi:hypothetical protein
MESQKVEKPEAAATERSTIEFPYSDIDNAQEIVRGIHAIGGTACTYEQLAAHLNAEPKGGGFRLRVNGAKTYGVVDYERGGTIRITDLGYRLIDTEKERAARVDAFLSVPLFSKAYEEFKGRQLPPQAGLERTLRSFGVGAKVADRARQVMLRAAKQAGFLELQPDRLTLPPVKTEKPADTIKKDEGKGAGTGGTGSGGGIRHPFIEGLIQTLPAPNTPWSTKERANWLNTAANIFKIIYQSEDSDDITITVEKGETTANDLV